jgi:hypothetical protein
MTLRLQQHATILAGVLCTFAGLLRADDPAPIDAEAEQQAAEEATSREAGRVQFRIEGGAADLDAAADSILKWSNPDVGRVYGNVYLWTEGGRPVVATSVYQWFYPYQDLTLEFCSLSERFLQGRYDGETVWNTEHSGVTWHEAIHRPPRDHCG